MGEKVNVLLFGFGALGGFYAWILDRNPNVSLTVVARSNYEQVRKNGLKIESQFHGNHTAKLDKVVQSIDEVRDERPDYIVCVTKAINVDSFLPLFKDIATEQTTFVVIQNGVGNEDPFRKAYPQCTILSCVAWVGAKQDDPGIIKHFAIENTQIGLFRNEKHSEAVENDRLDKFATLLKDGKTPVEVEENVQIQRWEKVIWNAAWNSMSAITQVDSQEWLKSSEHARPTLRKLMSEMLEVAQRSGLKLDDDIPDTFIDRMASYPPVYGSMYADLMNSRPMEVEVLLGTPLKKAQELGIDAPVLGTFYSIAAAIDRRIDDQKWAKST